MRLPLRETISNALRRASEMKTVSSAVVEMVDVEHPTPHGDAHADVIRHCKL
jgi:hypothetical protein